jgi:hypothetical protein
VRFSWFYNLAPVKILPLTALSPGHNTGQHQSSYWRDQNPRYFFYLFIMPVASIIAIVHNSGVGPGGLSERRLPKRFSARPDSNASHRESARSAVNAMNTMEGMPGEAGRGSSPAKERNQGISFQKLL